MSIESMKSNVLSAETSLVKCDITYRFITGQGVEQQERKLMAGVSAFITTHPWSVLGAKYTCFGKYDFPLDNKKQNTDAYIYITHTRIQITK